MSKIKRTIILLFCLCLCSTACTIPIPDLTGATPPETSTDIEQDVINSDLKLSFSYKYADTTEVTNQLNYIEVIDEDHNALKESLKTWFENELNYEETINLMDEEAQLSDQYYYLYSKIDIIRMDNKVLSLFESCETFTGGVHPNIIYNTVNFDITNGVILTLNDVINDMDSFKQVASEYILDIIENTDYFIFEGAKDIIKEFSEDTFEWNLSQYGLDIHYVTYALSDYASGPLHITLPYNEFKDYMNPEYFELSGDCVCSKYDYYDSSNNRILLPTKDGVIALNTEMDYADEYNWTYTISVGNDSETITNAARFTSLNFIRQNDIWYALVVIDTASADYQSILYRLTSDGIVETDRIDAQFTEGNISVNNYTLYTTIYILGTYFMEKEYYINDNGQFATEDELYTITATDYVSELVTKTELPVIIDGNEEILPAGSTVCMYQTDGESKVYLYIMDTAEIAELELSKSENTYSYVINGISEYDCFESLPYAG